MKIASIHLQNFKRFTDLKIQNIPAMAKLVILLGPNGCGKSSVFDALHRKSCQYRGVSHSSNADYYSKILTQSQQLDIEFYNVSQSDPDIEKAIYVRTAYRNTPVINVDSIQRMPSAIQEKRFSSMIDNDAAVAGNYQRLISNALERAFRKEDREITLGQFQKEILGEIQEAMKRLFP